MLWSFLCRLRIFFFFILFTSSYQLSISIYPFILLCHFYEYICKHLKKKKIFVCFGKYMLSRLFSKEWISSGSDVTVGCRKDIPLQRALRGTREGAFKEKHVSRDEQCIGWDGMKNSSSELMLSIC